MILGKGLSRIVLLALVVLASSLVQPLRAQTVPVTLKYVAQPGETFVRILAPNNVVGWGVAPGAPTVMTFVDSLEMYQYSINLQVGQTMEYKFHKHLNASGSQNIWLSDPANPETNPANNNNSVLRVKDLFLLELDWKYNEAGQAVEVSAGIFGVAEITDITLAVNEESLDGLPFWNPETGILRYVLPEPVPSEPLFKLDVEDADGRTVSGQIGALRVAVDDQPRPPGTGDGINYADGDPTTVTLSLFAPGKNFVQVIGDFNDWTPTSDFVMKRDSVNADSAWFWLRLDGLEPGREYGFQYLVDGQIRVGDPYSEKVLDPANDAEIGDAYPNLKEYPTDKTSEIVSVFQTNAESFEWTATDYVRPPQSELVIYEMVVRDFVAAHQFATLIDTLDYLEDLGINAIELMPVAEFSGNSDWGYEPNFVFAADKYYGPAANLKRFVDACHARGIAVILDVVYNHTAYEAPFSRLYSSSPTGAPGASPSSDNPWLNTVARHPFNVFNDVNHESSATKYWLDRANSFWLSEFKVDGFRFDLSKGFTQTNTGGNVGAWGNYDQSRINLLTRMADQIWAQDSTAYVILEHLAVEKEELVLASHGIDRGFPGMMLWNKMTGPYTEGSMGYNTLGKSNLKGSYFGSGGRNWPTPNLVTYMESHDEQWIMFKNIRFGACEAAVAGAPVCGTSESGYSTRKLPVALDRMKLIGTFFLTIPGPRMIWQFGELGYGHGADGTECLRPSNQPNDFGDCPSGTPRRTGRKPIHWEYLDDPLRVKLYKTWAALLRLRKQHEVFRSVDTEVELSVAGAVKTIALSNADMDVAIIGNFAVIPQEGVAPFSTTGTWYNFFSGDSLVVGNPDTTISLLPGEFHLFTNQRVESPESDLITVSAEPQTVPEAYQLNIETYPNPFADSVDIRYLLSEAGPVTLALFDSVGRQIVRIDKDFQSAGRQSQSIQLGDIAPGTYFVRLTTPTGFGTVPMVKVGSSGSGSIR